LTFDIVYQCILLGLSVGLVSSVLGLGGGILVVPLLPLIVQLTVREIVGTALLVVFLIVTLNSYRFQKRKLIDWKIALPFGISAAIGAMIAAWSTGLVDGRVIQWTFFAVLLVLGLRLFFPEKGRAVSTKPSWWWLIPVGTFAGGLSGFVGGGTGLLLTPILISFRLVPSQKVAPTANACLMQASLAGVLVFALAESSYQRTFGLLNIEAALIIFAGAAVSSFLGARYQARFSQYWRRIVLGGLLIGLAIRTLYWILNS
jgi:uncharacterized membrane protein YfcA